MTILSFSTASLAEWSACLTTKPDVSCSIPGTSWEFGEFLETDYLLAKAARRLSENEIRYQKIREMVDVNYNFVGY